MAAEILSPVLRHQPVLLEPILHHLGRRGGVILDATVGGAGHAEALLDRSPRARLVAFDRDPAAVEAARDRLARFGQRATIVHAPHSEAAAWLDRAGLRLDGLLADLGVSSTQLDDPARGMSFRAAGPLDMRMDPTRGPTALDLLQALDQGALADTIYALGEEHRSRRVARCVKRALDAGALHTTLDLRRAIVQAVGPRRVGGVDPATRTFQALRIHVNDELGELAALLGAAPRLVRPGGVVAFVAFHSLEDRLVKRALRDRSIWAAVTRKPIVADAEEVDHNPRARSAKLRVAVRVDEGEAAGRSGGGDA